MYLTRSSHSQSPPNNITLDSSDHCLSEESIDRDDQSEIFYSSSDDENDLWEEDCYRQSPHLQLPDEHDLSVETDGSQEKSEPEINPVCPCSACARGNLIPDIYNTGCIRCPESTDYGAKSEFDPVSTGCQTDPDPFVPSTSDFATKSLEQMEEIKAELELVRENQSFWHQWEHL